MTTLDAAIDYLRKGFCPIPIQHRNKRPVIKWSDFRFRMPSEAEVHNWFEYRDELNIGLVTGHNGLVVIDFDNMGVYENWLRWAAGTSVAATVARLTYRVRTSRGIHVYVRLAEIPGSGALMDTDGNRAGIDIKARGGYVLAPPSVHPSGALYRAERLHTPVLMTSRLSDVLPASLLIPPPTRLAAPVTKSWSSTPWGEAGNADARASEKIKRSIRIESFLGQLYQTGDHYYVTRCPLHDDNNPSMWVDTERQICGCFAGCTQKALDVIDLYARTHGVSAAEAIRVLVKSL